MCYWKITIDHLDEGIATSSAVGKGNLPKHSVALPFSFRLYDDDGELYFSGQSSDRDSQAAFAPLDWAMAYAGCTRIDYKQDSGKWEIL